MNYYQPETLDEALAIRATKPVVVLAGGTDVYPARATRRAWGNMDEPDVLDISRLPLRGIEEREDHWRIGALSTWSEVVRAPLPPLFDGLKEAGRAVGGIQIQNRGTVAGNICNASPAADGVPCLLTLDASVEIASCAGSRNVALAEFLTGYRKTSISAGEIVTAISIPNAPGSGRFHKLGARKYLVISIVMAAGVLDVGEDGIIAGARIAVGACTPVAVRLPGLERDLIGKPIGSAHGILDRHHFAALAPIDDVRASSGYRTASARALVADMLQSYAEAFARSA